MKNASFLTLKATDVATFNSWICVVKTDFSKTVIKLKTT